MVYVLQSSDGIHVENPSGSQLELVTRGRTVRNSTSTPVALTEADSGALLTNVGAASTVEFDLPELPPSTWNVWFEAYVMDAVGLRLDAHYNGSYTETIHITGLDAVNGRSIESTEVGAYVRLAHVSGNYWHVLAISGTWSVEV